MKGSKNKTIKKKLKFSFPNPKAKVLIATSANKSMTIMQNIFPPKSINKKLNKTLSMMKLSLFVNFSATIHTDLLKSYYLKNFLHLLLKNFPNKRYVQQRPINFKNHKKKRSLFKNPNYSCKNQPKII